MLFLTSISFLSWLFWHKGFKHGFNQHLEKESLWFFMFMMSYLITAITRHFRKERKGDEDFVLNIKKEIKYKK